jgi:DNA polymerase-3 subunit epsilon
MHSASGAHAGVQLRPADTLLVDRARDYLAGGPADVIALVGHICQLPIVTRAIAEQMAAALFAGRPEFACDAAGRWRLAAATPAGGEAGASPRSAAPPTFDEWMARRREPAPAVERATPPRPSPDDDLLSSLPYVVVDVETTGGRPGAGDRVTEIAAVAVRGGEIAGVFESLVNPERSIPPMITAITNITWEMVRDQPTFGEICPDVVEALRGNVFVAHNATFDWRFVAHEVGRASGQQLDGRRLCTVRLARRLLPHLPRRSLDWVARYYGADIPAEVRHRAAGDAIATAHVLLGLLRDAADRGITTWRHMDEFLGARTARSRRRRTAMPGPIDKDTTA